MDPIKFPEANREIAKNQPQYRPMHVYIDPGPEGIVVSCWKLNWWERIQVLLTGKIWQSMFCFHEPVTPSKVCAFKNEILADHDTWLQKVKRVADKIKVNHDRVQ